MVDFAGSHVVVTGGTGALGRAVIGALRAAGAICHVPNLVASELDGFPYVSDSGVRIARGVDLADEAWPIGPPAATQRLTVMDTASAIPTTYISA